MTARVVRLAFPARAEYVILARLALAGIARAVPIDEETLADLKLALTEACANVVKHAYAEDGPGGPVRITISVDEDAIAVAVEDEGVGPPPERRGRVGESADVQEDGMGLAIIGALTTDVALLPAGADGGTVLRFRKALEA